MHFLKFTFVMINRISIVEETIFTVESIMITTCKVLLNYPRRTLIMIYDIHEQYEKFYL